MFARKQTGLVDLLATALCVWAAVFHTPAGALVRGLIAKARGTPGESRPLLAYYTGGVYDAKEVIAQQTPQLMPAELTALAAVPQGQALARGIYVAATKTSGLSSGITSVDDAQQKFSSERQTFSTDDAAVLALFAGDGLARYAAQRARAEGHELTLEVLSRQLPPSSRNALDAASRALTLGTAFGLNWPVAPGTRISSPFGYRTHPSLGTQQLHTGVDLVVAEGTEVRAVADGTVRRASEDDVNGRIVILDHGRGVMTAYCHNSKLLVKVGQLVRAGDVISESGNTGRSTGAHLHYQLELAHRPTDPQLFRGGAHVNDVDVPVAPPPAAPTAPKATNPSAALKAAFEQAATRPNEENATEVTP